ncbi:GNAT family N-acetyltransferase [Microbaculum marinum]|uniref:GNAT family N-acetyltransferase n=1 Tax=Microbaculum marinum TaxID=1764581 RepID=A0AAW9S2F8_9HYPH
MSDPLLIRRARRDEAAALSDLAMRAKAHWGYDDAFMEMCRDELTIHPERIETGEVWVAERDGAAIGLLEVRFEEDGEAEVQHCFVDPSAMASGIGRRLWAKAEDIARAAGVAAIGVDSDPNAEGFYQAMGAVTVARSPSGSIPGRTLPRLRKRLAPSAA